MTGARFPRAVFCGLLFFSLILRGGEHEHVNGFRLTNFALPEVPATTDLQIADASRDPVATKYVNRGFELLLSGAREEASLFFRSAYHTDPDCILAYWGMAFCWLDDPVTARLYANTGVNRSRRAEVPGWQARWLRELQSALRGARDRDGLSEGTRGRILASLESSAGTGSERLLAEALYLLFALESGSVVEGGRLPYVRMVEQIGVAAPEIPSAYLRGLSNGSASESKKASPGMIDRRAEMLADSGRWSAAAVARMEALKALLRLRERYRLPFDGDPEVARRIRSLLELCATHGSPEDLKSARDFIANFPRRYSEAANEEHSIVATLAAWDRDEASILEDAEQAGNAEPVSRRVVAPGKRRTRPASTVASPAFRFASAPEWEAPNDRGEWMNSEQMKGQAYLAVFYLGEGCLHCMEQLQSILPFSEQFAEAGIDLLAFSTDTQENLSRTTANVTEADALPFTLLADAELTAFRAFGAYNDFKDDPLHGVFLVDAHGRLLWWEIGPHPYEDIAHLLDESKRLLAQSGRVTPDRGIRTPTVRRIPVAEAPARSDEGDPHRSPGF